MVNEGNTHRGTNVTVTLSGPAAMEIRRVATNLNITPQMLMKDLLAEGLRSRYGITVK